LVGNPAEYIFVFGGSTAEYLPGDYQVYKLKKTLNDIWVYHTGKRQWSELFVNSINNPSPRDGSASVALKKDRQILIFGGQMG